MPVALQIRDVPDEVRAVLADHARGEGQSLQAYLLSMVLREARLMQNAQAFERTTLLRVTLSPEHDPAMIIREGRDEGFEADRTTLDRA